MALFDIMNAVHPVDALTPVDADYLVGYDVSTKEGKKCLVSALSTKMQADVIASATGIADSKIYLNCQIPDISSGSSTWVVCPVAGTIENVWTVINGAIITVDAGISLEIGGTAVTDGGITIAFTASAAGVVDTCAPSALNVLTAGGAIEVITDGASTNTVTADVIIEILPT